MKLLVVVAVLGLIFASQCAARPQQQQQHRHRHRRSLLANNTTAATKPEGPKLKAAAVAPSTPKAGAAATAPKANVSAANTTDPASSNSTAKAIADIAGASMRMPIGSDYETLLPQRDFGLRVDGSGRLGRVENTLLERLNDLADRVPRVGAEAVTRTTARGDRTAQRRTSTAILQTLPLNAQAQSTGGAAAVDDDTAVTAVDSTANTVAKDIVDDAGGHSVDLGGISRVQGITVTQGAAGRPGGSQTVGQANAEAGERTGIDSPVFTRVFDGGLAANAARQQALGDQVSTRLQTGNLVSTADAGGGPTNSGGSVIFGQADTEDLDGDYSATNSDTFGKKFNTQAILASGARSNRYKYTEGTSVADIRAVGTRNAYAGLESGEFGTGFQTGRTNVKASTPLVYSRDN